MEENLPPGFRFHPTDEELITYYLTNKVSDFSFTSRAVADVDINKCEPWDLPDKASMGEKEWYFFNLKDRKYPTGLRTNRATEAGYWKTTGKDKEIFRSGVLIGMKKTLVFYRGRAPKGEKTNWVMHEYRQESKHSYKQTKEEWVVCRVFQKSTIVKKAQQTSSSPQSMESPCDTNTLMVNELCDDIELQDSSDQIGISLSNIPNLSSQNFDNNSMNGLMNWTTPRNSLTWPSSLLSPNLTINSWLLRALQLRNYQLGEINNCYVPGLLTGTQGLARDSGRDNNDYSLILPQGFTQTGNDISSGIVASSSSRSQPRHEEQPYNLDSGIFGEAGFI